MSIKPPTVARLDEATKIVAAKTAAKLAAQVTAIHILQGHLSKNHALPGFVWELFGKAKNALDDAYLGLLEWADEEVDDDGKPLK